jgi:hypothetical protein
MSEEKGEEKHDVILVHGRTEDGEGIRALRSRPGRLESAEIRPAKEGVPIDNRELITLRERGESPLLWDVDVLYDGKEERGETTTTRAGPAQVATEKYRRNWELAFSSSADDEPEEPVLN